MYHRIAHSSQPGILIHPLNVTKVSNPKSSNLIKNTNSAKRFVKFLCSNMLFKSNAIDPANHTIVSRCWLSIILFHLMPTIFCNHTVRCFWYRSWMIHPNSFCKISWLLIIGNTCLNSLHACIAFIHTTSLFPNQIP